MKLLIYPHEDLRRVATQSDSTPAALIQNMKQIIDENDGLGLASTQVTDGYNDRIILVKADVSTYVMINPQIVESIGDRYPAREGCLSFPGVFGDIPRYQHLKITFEDENRELQKREVYGDLAGVVQHEIDHLNGILLIDNMAKKDLKKNKKILQRLVKSSKSK